MTNEARRFLIYSAALFCAGGGVGGVGGRVTAPVPPAEVRYVPVQVPAPAPLAEAVPIEPAVIPPAAPVPVAPIEPPAATVAPPVEAKPLPVPRPKVEAAPKPKPAAQPKPRAPAPKKSLPSCAVVQQKYNAMSWAQRMAEYHSASPEEIAYGKRCLGF